MSTVAKKSNKKTTTQESTPINVAEQIEAVYSVENDNLDESSVDLDLNLAEYSVNNLGNKTLAQKRELYVKLVTVMNKYIIKVRSLDKLRLEFLEAAQYTMNEDDLTHDTLDFDDDEVDNSDEVQNVEPVVEEQVTKKTKKVSKKDESVDDLIPVENTTAKKSRAKKTITTAEPVEATTTEEPVKKTRAKKTTTTAEPVQVPVPPVETVSTEPQVNAVTEEPVKKTRAKKTTTAAEPSVEAVTEEPAKKSRAKKTVTETEVAAVEPVSVSTESVPKAKSGRKKATA